MADSAPGLAVFACAACRSQKRKCTKELPICHLCRKHDRPCVYSSQPPTSASTVLEPREGGGNVVTSQADFPASYFLDHEFFQTARPTLPRRSTESPPQMYKGLQNEQELRQEVGVYFDSVHAFFPIISKLRFHQEGSNTKNELNIDTVLLLMAMQLHTRSPEEDEPQDWERYQSARSCFSQVQDGNCFSIRLVQSAVLIALYEMANAIFPAAYLTIGHCARLSHAIGLHNRKRAPQMLPDPTTQNELEERRRVWWAVYILDRYINIGIRACPFATTDMRADEFLPIDDKHWDQGQLVAGQPLAISASTTSYVPPFARACQSSHILSRTLQHRDDMHSDVEPELRYQEAFQLHLTVNALYATISQEAQQQHMNSASNVIDRTQYFTATGLCLSALLSLYDTYACIEAAPAHQLQSAGFLEMHRTSIASLQTTLNAVHVFAESITESAAAEGGLMKLSPLICDCMYQAATFCLWQLKESASVELEATLRDIRAALKTLGTRWKAPREYSRMLQEYEGHYPES